MTKEMTISEYIETIQTMGDVMNLAKQLKKADMDERTLNMVMSNALSQLMDVNHDEYERYMEYVGCHSGISEEYGCMKYHINTNHGGTITISDWIGVEFTTSLATISISNGWGLGSTNHINNLQDINEQIMSAGFNTWINDDEREFLIETLENLKRGIK